jgi:hypothetical protein
MNILSLFPKHLYDTKMSPGRTLYLEHVGKLHNVIWSGDGWPSWHSDLPANENIDWIEEWEECKFDAVIVYKGSDLIAMDKVKTPKFVIFNEAHDQAMLTRELTEANADVAVFHHESDYVEYRNVIGSTAATWCHAAPVTPEVAWEDRKNYVITTGCTAEKIYPVRCRAARAMASFSDTLRHPGYRLPDRKAVVIQYASYLRALSNSKISICCSSVYKYPLAKLFESAMCGCVIATDLPACSKFEELLWPHCIQLSDEMTEESMKVHIRSYSDDELREMGRKSREIAMKHFSYDQWADCLITAIRDVC